jgi:hypothetical protein
LCPLNDSSGTAYLNDATVRTALHVDASPNSWAICGGVNYTDDGVYSSMVAIHKKMQKCVSLLKGSFADKTSLFGVLVFWYFGVLVFWCFGILVFWYFGILVFWCFGVLVFWCFGVMVLTD